MLTTQTANAPMSFMTPQIRNKPFKSWGINLAAVQSFLDQTFLN